MAVSPANYRIISSSEVNHSDVHEVAVGGDDSGSELYPITEHVLATAQIKWTYFLLGCAILLPFNVLFNATSFFLSRLVGSPHYPTFSSYLSSVYTWTKLACQFYCTFTSKQSSPSRRILGSLTTMVLFVASLCFSTFVRGPPPIFFAFVLSIGALMAVAVSYLTTAVYAGSAFLGTSFLRCVISGQATVSVAISAVQVASSVIALWSSPLQPVPTQATRAHDGDDQAEEIAARIFFGASAVFLCITLAAYTWLTWQSSYKSATDALERAPCRVEVPDERAGLIADGRKNASIESNSHIYQVFRENLIFMFSIAYLFVVTLAVYPAVTARVRPVNTGIHPLLFTSVHFFVMNLGGFVGQYSCSFPRLVVWSGKKILAMSLLRTLFIPLLLLCNVERTATTSVSLAIRSDILFMVIVLIMGYTTGYLSTAALLAVSSLEHNPRLKGRREDVDVAATLGGSCMILGLAFGALSSFGVQAMI